ncbi:MAG: aryl-sulfate sulfotransferase, partial [Bacteroidia bacterium]
MNYFKLCFLILLFTFCKSTALGQYSPFPGEILNYNQIMFEYPTHQKASYYKIEIAFNKTGNGRQDLLTPDIGTFTDSSGACMIEGLPFGKKYFWKVTAYDVNNKILQVSPVINFALMVCDYCDTTLFKHAQHYNKKDKYRDGLIWCDTYHCAINRSGNVVWFFPIIDQNFENPAAMRDMRIHKDGNISFFNDSNVFLIDRDLTVLWNGPKNAVMSGQKIQHFHHTFNVISNNNFYTLGNTYKKLFNHTGLKDSLDNYLVSDHIIQYDSLGTVKWFWNYEEEFFDSTIFKGLDDEKKTLYLHPHMNALSVDSAETFVYVSLRNLSRILKIEKSTKKIVAQFGPKFFESDPVPAGDIPFNYQHDVKYLGNNRVT